MSSDLFSSATQQAAAIRGKQISAVELLDAHLTQIDQHNPALNAIVTLDIERAHQRARAADDALARNEVWGPLHGVPFTLKDAFATAGMRSTIGFPPFDHVPSKDSTVAARLLAAGGVLIGKTNVAMLLADFQTNNPIFGRTNNPWDVACTPGGSSGGAAAAVAAGMTPFDIGTDLSGSIRIPAHFCGLYCVKPTEHRISLAGLFPIPHDPPPSVRIMSSIGPLTRSVEDLVLLFSLIAGPDNRDTDVPPVPVVNWPAIPLSQLRIAVAPTFPGLPVAAEIRGAIDELATQLRRAGATVKEAAIPARDFRDDLSRAGQLIGMTTGAFQAEEGESTTTLAQYLTALHRRDQSIIAWEQFFTNWDALLCPPAMITAFPHCEPGSPLQVDGRDVEYWAISGHTTLFNFTGHPAVVLPFTRDPAGLPLGIQLVGRRWEETHLLAVAQAIAELTASFQRPPSY